MTKSKIIRNTLFAIATLMLTMTAVAQDSPGSDATIRPRVTITVTVDGLNCTTSAGPGTFSALTWNFGVTEASTSGGGGAGKPSFGNFNITKHFNACSSALFEAVAVGKFFKTVTIVQQDSNNDDVLTVTLSDALLSGYQLGGELGHELPTEHLSFTFSKILISESKSGAKIGWSPSSDK
jgi:type VI protein secretion system component Hcp